MKIAYLVTFAVTTRVEVEVADDLQDKDPETNDGLFAEIADAAADRILDNGVDTYLCYDNVEKIVEDTECPA